MFSIFKRGDSTSDTQLTEALAQGATVIDVRTESEFAAGHAPGSKNIPLDIIEAEVKALSIYNQIVVCCRSGARSGQAKAILNGEGLTNVINGGSWQNVMNHLKK